MLKEYKYNFPKTYDYYNMFKFESEGIKQTLMDEAAAQYVIPSDSMLRF